jgi:hypothetical protein
VIMLFDSCFSGSLFTLVRAVPHDISEKISLPVRQYITAGREDEQVPDRSMFKRSFLIGLEGDADLTGDGYITGTELGMYLADNVVNYTHRRQHPQFGKINNPDLDRGDFVFVPGNVVIQEYGKEIPEQYASSPLLKEEWAKLEAERKKLADEKRKIEEESWLMQERQRIAREQAELEAKRSQLEEEKKKLGMVKFPGAKATTPTGYTEVAYDENFILYSNGIVLDTQTNLEWIVGEKIGYLPLKDWVQHLSAEGGKWRIPTEEELRTLYKKGAGPNNLSPIFNTNDSKIWADTVVILDPGQVKWYYDLRKDKMYPQYGMTFRSDKVMGFAVRKVDSNK